MKALVAVILLVIGVWLIHSGWSRRQSLAGEAESTITDLKRKWDGEARAPDYIWQLAGGGVLVLTGGLMLVSKRKG